MTSLYLSSFHLGAEPDQLARLVPPDARTAVVMNAADVFGATSRMRLPANLEALRELRLSPDEVDLRDYFGAPEKLARTLEPFSLIWAVGGNAFVLRRAMRYAGLDVVVRARVTERSLVWAGFSAGAVVAGPTLEGVEFVDDPADVPVGYDVEVIWDGLGLVDRTIVPHYRSEHPESSMVEDMVSHLDARHLPYLTLRDGEALVVAEGDERIVGARHPHDSSRPPGA